MDISLSIDRCLAAPKFLAAATSQLFPKVTFVQDWVDFPYFAYEMVFPFALNEEIFSMLSDKLKELIKKGPEVRFMEMVPSNAINYFKHLGREDLATVCKEIEEPLIQLVEISGFVDFANDFFDASSLDHTQVALLGYEEVKDSDSPFAYRIIGVACESLSDVKEFKKIFKVYFSVSHKEIGKKLSLFGETKEGELYFLEKGIFAKKQLELLREKELEAQGFLQIERSGASVNDDPFSCHYELSCDLLVQRVAERFSEGVFDKEDFLDTCFNQPVSSSDVNHIFIQKQNIEDSVKSCLQLLHKIPKIYRLKCQGVLNLPSKGFQQEREVFKRELDELGVPYTIEEGVNNTVEYELKLYDGLRRLWNVASCKMIGDRNKKSIPVAIEFSMISSVDRLLYLILEQNSGILPVSLLVEEARFIPLIESEDLIKDVARRLEHAGLRVRVDKSKGSLSEKLKKGWKERIPYAIILGAKEVEQNIVTLVELSNHTSTMLSLEQVCDFLIKQRA